MPSAERLRQRDSLSNEFTKDAINCAILWGVLLKEFGEDFFNKKVIVSASFHHWLQRSKKANTLLNCAKDIALVTHTLNLSPDFYNYFQFNSVLFIPVPGETWSRNTDLSSHYPFRYDELLNYFSNAHCKNRLFLIGAGVLGKIYCSKIKKNGGVAIDFGAVLDGWNGVIPNERVAMKKNQAEMGINYLIT